jgi:hypothetical protein
MSLVEVIMLKPLVAYHDGFTKSFYEVNTKQSFDKDFAEKQIEAGICEAFLKRETKPAIIKKETKTRVKVKSEKQSKRSTSN